MKAINAKKLLTGGYDVFSETLKGLFKQKFFNSGVAILVIINSLKLFHH